MHRKQTPGIHMPIPCENNRQSVMHSPHLCNQVSQLEAHPCLVQPCQQIAKHGHQRHPTPCCAGSCLLPILCWALRCQLQADRAAVEVRAGRVWPQSVADGAVSEEKHLLSDRTTTTARRCHAASSIPNQHACDRCFLAASQSMLLCASFAAPHGKRAHNTNGKPAQTAETCTRHNLQYHMQSGHLARHHTNGKETYFRRTPPCTLSAHLASHPCCGKAMPRDPKGYACTRPTVRAGQDWGAEE